MRSEVLLIGGRSGARSAALLDRAAPADVVRVRTDGRTPGDVAAGLGRLVGWARPRA